MPKSILTTSRLLLQTTIASSQSRERRQFFWEILEFFDRSAGLTKRCCTMAADWECVPSETPIDDRAYYDAVDRAYYEANPGAAEEFARVVEDQEVAAEEARRVAESQGHCGKLPPEERGSN